MSFWNTSDNKELDTSGKFEVGGSMEPIPGNTALKAMITEASWDEFNGDSHIKVRWDVIDGDHKNRVVYQKIRVQEQDSKKRDRAIGMLAAIDANAGGKLIAKGHEPTDMDLQSCLLNKPMWIKVQVWEIDGKTGNWVSAVSGGGASKPQAQPQAPVEPQADLTGDDIPF